MLSDRERNSIEAQSLDRLLEWHLRCRGTPNSVEDLLDMVSASSADAIAADRSLQHWVAAARRYGATWQEIGEALGSSRQAAQKRFGDTTPPRPLPLSGAGYRVIDDVEIADETSVLSAQGAEGFILTEVGTKSLTFVDATSKVEHRRVPFLANGPAVEEYRADGWEVVAREYPFVYLARSSAPSTT